MLSCYQNTPHNAQVFQLIFLKEFLKNESFYYLFHFFGGGGLLVDFHISSTKINENKKKTELFKGVFFLGGGINKDVQITSNDSN